MKKHKKDFVYRGDRNVFQKPMPPIPKFELCAYCEAAYGDSWDHIIPYSYGGTEHLENLILCCRNCNSTLSNSLFYNALEKKLFIEYMKRGFSRKSAWKRVEAYRQADCLRDLSIWLKAHVNRWRDYEKNVLGSSRISWIEVERAWISD